MLKLRRTNEVGSEGTRRKIGCYRSVQEDRPPDQDAQGV